MTELKAKKLHKTSEGSPLERLAGMSAIAVFSLCYYYSTIYIIAIVVLLVYSPLDRRVWLFCTPMILSVLLPPMAAPRLFNNWFFKSALRYHEYEEVLETTEEELEKLQKKKKFIHAIQPHGVLSVVGICTAINRAPLSTPPTAAASILLQLPILKHVFGTMNLVDASSKSLTKALKLTSVVIYIGGMAELFLSNPNEEKLYIKERKGFIKLALRTGCDVIPSYFFGNTTAFEVVRNEVLQTISRKTGISTTLMWGRWGLFPLPRKVLHARGRPLGMPHLESPSQEDIDKWHAKYVEEVKRLYYKVGCSLSSPTNLFQASIPIQLFVSLFPF
ncbi:unnamed protein product [Chrysoparadoxa australica]